MKFFHLSDLHIGKTVNGFSMIEEQKNVFAQIISHIKSIKPSAIIFAGDIYDRAVPSVEAVQVFDNFLTELCENNIAIMLISGNHDSPERINYASRLLSDRNIFFYGIFDGSLKKIVLNDEYGEINFYLMPFIKPLSAVGLFGEREMESYDELISYVIKKADIDFSCRNVLVSHQFYSKAGLIAIRSDSEQNPVGSLDAVDADIIKNFDYAALGHLHGRQEAGSPHICYSGSPLKYSFSEWRHEKSISLIEIKEKGNLKIEFLPLNPIHQMREIRGKIDDLISKKVSEAEGKNDYLRAILIDEEEIIDPMGKLRSVYPNIMSLDFENSRITPDQFTEEKYSGESLTPYQMFEEFFLDTMGSTMSSGQKKIVQDLLERISAE